MAEVALSHQSKITVSAACACFVAILLNVLQIRDLQNSVGNAREDISDLDDKVVRLSRDYVEREDVEAWIEILRAKNPASVFPDFPGTRARPGG